MSHETVGKDDMHRSGVPTMSIRGTKDLNFFIDLGELAVRTGH